MKKIFLALGLLWALCFPGLLSAQDQSEMISDQQYIAALSYVYGQEIFHYIAESYNRSIVDKHPEYLNKPKGERPYIDSYGAAILFGKMIAMHKEGNKEATLIFEGIAAKMDLEETIYTKIAILERLAQEYLKTKKWPKSVSPPE